MTAIWLLTSERLENEARLEQNDKATWTLKRHPDLDLITAQDRFLVGWLVIEIETQKNADS